MVLAMGNLLALITFGCFCVLASYSLGATHKSERIAKPVLIWRTAKAASIADVWGLTPEEVDKPIRIFEK